MPSLSSTHTKLFLTAWFVFAVHFSTNVMREHYPAFALIKHGTFQVDEYQGLHPDIFVHTDGHSYIGNNVATSVLASVPLLLCNPVLDALEAYSKSRLEAGEVPAGEYRVDKPLRREFFQEVSARGLALRFGAATAITSVLLIAPLSALCVVALFQMLLDRGVTQGRALWLAILFAFGTPLFFRSAHLTNNIFVMYFTFAAFWLLWPRQQGASPPGTGRLLGAGFCAGMTLACDYSGLIPLLCLAGYAVLRGLFTDSKLSVRALLRPAVPFALGCALPVAFLLYSQWAMYGNPFLPGQAWMPAVNYTDRGWRGFALPSPVTFCLNLLHPSYGLLAFGPILLLGFLPAWRYSSDTLVLPRPERLFTAGFVAVFLLFCAANQYSLMQFNTGFRYLLPLLPFLFLAACDHLARLSRPVLIALTIPVLLHSWVLCMARDCNPNEDTWRAATSLTAFLAQIAQETVPASYLRIWQEGLQLPWLRVLALTAPKAHPVLGQPWLPAAILAVGGLMIFALWRFARKPETVQDKAAGSVPGPLPTVAVVVPVLNEAHVLEKSIRTLRGFLLGHFPYPAQIVVVDNGSTDGTADVARQLMALYSDVSLITLPMRGRGRALRTAWSQVQADIVAYMDVDLSTELTALEKLCRGIHEEGYDIGTGSRLLPESKVTRCFKREVLSRGYNLFLRWVLWTHFSDAQCGFKVVSRQAIDVLLPLIENQHWFFDTELLVLGEKLGYRIKDVPVKWDEDPDSRVKILRTVWEDIQGVFRLRWMLWSGRLRGWQRPAQAPQASEPSAMLAAVRSPAQALESVPATK